MNVQDKDGGQTMRDAETPGRYRGRGESVQDKGMVAIANALRALADAIDADQLAGEVVVTLPSFLAGGRLMSELGPMAWPHVRKVFSDSGEMNAIGDDLLEVRWPAWCRSDGSIPSWAERLLEGVGGDWSVNERELGGMCKTGSGA